MGGQQSKHVALALQAASRSARGFMLYEAKNQILEGFVASYRESMLAAAAMGAIEMDVRPFEIVCDGHIVYTEPNRERSLAYVLFRDGVRRVVLKQGASWANVSAFLEILVVCFVARQTEHDFVTLFYNRTLDDMSIVAVEGFQEDDVEVAGGKSAEVEALHAVPHNWDHPIPPLEGRARLAYMSRDQGRIDQRLDDLDPANIPEKCNLMCGHLFRALVNPHDPTSLDDLLPFVEEVAVYFLRNGHIGPLSHLLGGIHTLHGRDPNSADRLLDCLGGHRIVADIIASQTTVDAEQIAAVLKQLPGTHLVTLIDMVAAHEDPETLDPLLALVKRFGATDPDYLLMRIDDLPPHSMVGIVSAMVDERPETALNAALAIVDTEDMAVRMVCAELIDKAPVTEAHTDDLLDLADGPTPSIRLAAIRQLANTQDQSCVEDLVVMLRDARPKEAAAIGRTLARLDGANQEAAFVEWIKPSKLIKRLAHKDQNIHYAAVAGLIEISAERHKETIRHLAAGAGSQLAEFCLKSLSEARSSHG